MNLIVAVNQINGIGINNYIPWHNKNDMKFFKMMTYSNNIYMGRKTFESLGKPLPGRLNHILSSKHYENCFLYNNSDDFLNKIKNDVTGFVIGGESIYNMVLESNIIKNIYISKINNYSNCDKFFKIPNNFKSVSKIIFEDLEIERLIKE